MHRGFFERAGERLRGIWVSDRGRLIVLSVYYLGIIVGLAVIHGGRHAPPPPFIYQGF